MNTGTKWGIGLGVGIPGALILIGIIGILVKFFMKRCRTKAWDDISSLPKHFDPSASSTNIPKPPKRASTEREPLYPITTNNALGASNSHIAIPIDENDLPPGQAQGTKQQEHTLVQIQRDRLTRLKDEKNRLPAVSLSQGEDGIQHAIDQAQREFEESVANALAKSKRRQDN